MFIKINDKQHLLDELNKYFDSTIVFHYNCSNCEDEQVMYEQEVDDNLLENIGNDDYIFVGLPCTECGYEERFSDIDNINGFETI